MNLKRLQTFILVAEHHGFSEAAHILDLTQSGVSRQIKTLEEELDVQLFKRSTSLVELTPAGRHVYKKAKSLLGQWDSLVQECQLFKSEWSGLLKIGASTIPGTYLLPQIVKSFRTKYPKMEFAVTIDDSSKVMALLENGQIDLAIVGSRPDPGRYFFRPVAKDRLVLIGGRHLAAMTSAGEMLKHPFIVREQGSGTRKAMDEALRRHGIEPEELTLAAEVNSTESILAMVEAGVGVSFVSDWVLKETNRDAISVLYEMPTDRRFYIVSLAARQSYPVIQLFIQEAEAVHGRQQ